MDIRRGQLATLLEAMDDLIAVLELDPQCEFVESFQNCATAGRELMASADQSELTSFSKKIVSIYEGPNGFEGYRPCAEEERRPASRRIQSFDNLETFSRVVFDRAIELRAITG